MRLKVVLVLTVLSALCVCTITAQAAPRRSTIKEDNADVDSEDDEDDPDDPSEAESAPLLLHELNNGPVIEKGPADLEVFRNQSSSSSSSSKSAAASPDAQDGHQAYLTCNARNALAIHVRCSPTNPSVSSTKFEKDSGYKRDTEIRDKVNKEHAPPTGAATSGDALVVPSIRLVDFVDPMTGVRHIEIKVNMNDKLLQRFPQTARRTGSVALYCACHAWSSKGHATSRVATVKFLPGSERKLSSLPSTSSASSSSLTSSSSSSLSSSSSMTTTEPRRRVVPLGDKVLLECPLGASRTSSAGGGGHDSRAVFWLWNGAEVLLNENVEVDSKRGSLLILRAGLANEGSYTCGVRGASGSAKDSHLAGARLGETVIIDIQSDGSWSPWGAWSDCSARCDRGFRTRTRSCTNPPARHGGRDCPGDYMQRSDCHSRRECGGGGAGGGGSSSGHHGAGHGHSIVSSAASRDKVTKVNRKVDHDNDNDDDDDDDDDEDEDDADLSTSAHWSQWSAWSDCGPDCKQHRQRWCSSGSDGATAAHLGAKDGAVSPTRIDPLLQQHQQQHHQRLLHQRVHVQHLHSLQGGNGLPAGYNNGYAPMHLHNTAATACSGRDHMSVNCTGGACPLDFNSFLLSQNGVENHLLSKNVNSNNNNNYLQDQQSPSPPHEQGFVAANFGSVQAVAMVIGMALATIILAFTFLIALRFWPRESTMAGDKRQPPVPLHMAYTTVPVSGLSTLQADVAASLERDPRLQEFITDRKLDAAATMPLLQQMCPHPNSCTIPATPSQTRANFLLSRSRTPSSTGKTHRSDSESHQSGQHGACSDYGAPGSSSEYDLIYDTIPDEVVPTTDGHNAHGSMEARSGRETSSAAGSLPHSNGGRRRHIAWLTVGPEGGRVRLDRLGVCLTVPAGAVRHGRREMYVAVLDDEKRELPANLRSGQGVLSAIVQCGPADVSLARPVILSFDHCAHASLDKWSLHLLTAAEGTDAHEPTVWRTRVSLDSPQDVDDVLCYQDGRTCHVQTDRLGRFALCGESRPGSFAAKSIMLLAFLAKRRSLAQAERTLKVYCVEDTPAAVETVLLAEQDDATLVESPKPVSLHDGGANLCFALEELSLPQGWSLKSSSLQEVPFARLWGSSCGSHCSFSLLSVSPSSSFSARDAPLECRLTVYQRGNQSHRQVLHVNSSTACPVYRNTGVPATVGSVAVIGRTRHGSPNMVVQHSGEATRLTEEVRSRLCGLLDAPGHNGSGDWVKLALHLGLERNMGYLASQVSPSACLLDLWEACRREEVSPSNLLTLLRHIGRPDAVVDVEKVLGAWV